MSMRMRLLNCTRFLSYQSPPHFSVGNASSQFSSLKFLRFKCDSFSSHRIICHFQNMESFNAETVETTPQEGQSPGTSGLRKPVKTFKKPQYTENFVQSIFNYLGDKLENSTLILGGDGRYYCREAAEIIIRMAAANKVGKLIVGQNGLISTPAASNLIRKHKALGGILLTASHNPGGPDHDFGIKFNSSNGGAASTTVTQAIYTLTTNIKSYNIVPDLECDLSKITSKVYMIDDHRFELTIIDPVVDYVNLMKTIFDFNAIQQLLTGTEDRQAFNILIDCMHAVTGPYAKAIFEDELKAPKGSVINAVPLVDFGGGHPDPNLVHAQELINKLNQGFYDFGAAFDGDGDRNMILGAKAFFISPSDSLAILASHIHCIPYFQKYGIKGVARSMPTSRALDRVAKDKNFPLYKVPTGWKFFCNLLDADKISLCGEESFGTGSSHIREKDGIWAVLAWLSVIRHMHMSVEEIAAQHWAKYGRDYYLRHDYEDLDAKLADEVLNSIFPRIEKENPKFSWEFPKKNGFSTVEITSCVDFSYTDPIDKTTVKNQGLIITLSNDSRIVFRKSGTGSSGATIRIYLERALPGEMWMYPKEKVIEPLVQVYLDISKIRAITGKKQPDVIT